jgi:hypothetical protein
VEKWDNFAFRQSPASHHLTAAIPAAWRCWRRCAALRPLALPGGVRPLFVALAGYHGSLNPRSYSRAACLGGRDPSVGSVLFFQAEDVGDDILQSSPFTTKLGIVTCVVRSATVRAALVMPAVLAMTLKVGALGLVEPSAALSMAWHSAHTSRANWRPSGTLPICCAFAVRK